MMLLLMMDRCHADWQYVSAGITVDLIKGVYRFYVITLSEKDEVFLNYVNFIHFSQISTTPVFFDHAIQQDMEYCGTITTGPQADSRPFTRFGS
ncbi:hypothetical protein Aduo_009495 [Ancylostoma duodenale]